MRTAQVLRNMVWVITMLIAGSLATTLNQNVVPIQPGSTAGAGASFHRTTHDGKIMGEYAVELPDGRTQHVIYTAGHDQGYVANISYSGEAKYPPSWIHGSRSYDYGGRIIEDTQNIPKPQKLTPTPVNVPVLRRPSSIVISEPQYGYRRRYSHPFKIIRDSSDSKYNSRISSSSFEVGNDKDINKSYEEIHRGTQQSREQEFKTSKRFHIDSATVPTITSSTTTLNPFYSYYSKAATHFKKSPRYQNKGSPLYLLQKPPTIGVATEYKKSNTIPDMEISNSDKESKPLYIPKYFDFALKRHPPSYPR
ncbi:unnamed protein product, partial [Meganyctiphanes norvegica]